jgi:protein SCO1/2
MKMNSKNILGALALSFLSVTFAAENKAAAPRACCVTNLAAQKPLSDKSLYQTDSTWTTDDNRRIKLATLAGKPVVLTMFFASCEYACPVLANDMRKLEAALPAESRANVNFVLVTFDTERDTPAALKKYRKTRDIPAGWTLLTATPDDILELAALLGVKYKKDARGQFAHSNVITILNQAGEVIRQQTGLNTDPAESVRAIQKLLVVDCLALRLAGEVFKFSADDD